MKMNTLIMIAFIFLTSCGDNLTEPKDKNEDEEKVTQEELDNLDKPCIDESITIQLPAPLQDPNNYTKFEQTILIWGAVELSNSMRIALSSIISPPETAINAEIDGIRITADDKGYQWTDGENKYVYKIKDNGYELYFIKPGELIGMKMAYMEQNEDCTIFEYVQYAIEDDGDKKQGDVEFRYRYDKAGTATIVTFGTDVYDANNDDYRIRSFEDLSGELTIRNGGDVSQTISWYTNGNGNYKFIEDNLVVGEGTWEF